MNATGHSAQRPSSLAQPCRLLHGWRHGGPETRQSKELAMPARLPGFMPVGLFIISSAEPQLVRVNAQLSCF